MITKGVLKKYQKAYNLSLKGYADKLNIDRQTLRNIYIGKTKNISSEISEKAIEIHGDWQAKKEKMDIADETISLTTAEKLLVRNFNALTDASKKKIWQCVFDNLLNDQDSLIYRK